VLQKAGNDALAAGATTKKTLEMVKRLRQKTQAPLLIMAYINPVFAYGLEKFAREAKEAGLDGLILPDVPEEEGGLVAGILAERGLALVHFLAPTSGEERIRDICRKAKSGFIYCLARTGVTGAGGGLDAGSAALVKTAREHSALPLAIGFGISDGASARQAADCADAAIVGSAVVEALRKGGAPAVGAFVRELRRALDA
jgi:tryptophan synthase alpha chain